MKYMCDRCLYWDQRPEEGMDYLTGYCMALKIIVQKKEKCDQFGESTPETVDELKKKLYGEVELRDVIDEYG